MKSYSVLELDRRYTGSHHFRYRVRVNGGPDYPESVDNFRQIMDWCSQTWGNSVDVDHHRILMRNNYSTNPAWAWQLRQPGMRRPGIDFHLFLSNNQELTLFELKFS